MESGRGFQPGKRRATPIPVLPPRIPTPMPPPPPNNNNLTRSSRIREQSTKVHPSSVGLDVPKLISKDSYKLLDNDVKTAWINPRLISKIDLSAIASTEYIPPELRNANTYGSYHHNLSHQRQHQHGSARGKEWEALPNGRRWLGAATPVPTPTQSVADVSAKRAKDRVAMHRATTNPFKGNGAAAASSAAPPPPKPPVPHVYPRGATPSSSSTNPFVVAAATAPVDPSPSTNPFAHKSARGDGQKMKMVTSTSGYQSRVDYVGGGVVGPDGGVRGVGVFGVYSETRYAFSVNGMPGNAAQSSAAAAFFARRCFHDNIKHKTDFTLRDYHLRGLDYIREKKSPRYLKTHLPFCFLPKQIVDGTRKPKIVSVMRNPKDVCVSMYHYLQHFYMDHMPSFEDHCNLFLRERNYKVLMDSNPNFVPREYHLRGLDFIKDRKHPRYIKTHLPFDLLPEQILNERKSKVIYVSRNPKDVCVSLFHFFPLYFPRLDISFEDHCELFMRGHVPFGNYWNHIFKAGQYRDLHNILFLKYEDMLDDLPMCIGKVAKFLGKSLNNSQVQMLCNHLSIKNMQNNPSMNRSALFNNSQFIRKGKVEGYKDEMNAEMVKKFNEWERANRRKYGINL